MLSSPLARSLALVVALEGAAVAQEPAPESFRIRHAKLEVDVDFAASRLTGTMTMTVENWTAHPASQVSLLLNRLMEATAVSDGAGKSLRYTQDVRLLEDRPMFQLTQIVVQLPRAVPSGSRTTVRIEYRGHLAPYAETGNLYVRDRIDTTFTILRSDAWAYPEIGGLNDAANRRAPSSEFTYEAVVRVPSAFLVATGGVAERTTNADSTTTWYYRSAGPSPFMNIAIARFDTLSEGGVRIFHFREDSAGARRVMDNAIAAIRTLTQWFGPPRGGASLTITEIPDGWGSQGDLVAGIIQQPGAFREATRMRELYHELSHVWNATDTDSPSPRWNEGLATFLEALLQERLNGWKGRPAYEEWYFTRLKGRRRDANVRETPFADYGKRDLTDLSYSLGSVMFATLYELVGEQDFNKIVGGYYQRMVDGGTTRDFAEHAKRVSTVDLSAFLEDWLFTTRWTSVIGDATSIGDLATHYRKTKSPEENMRMPGFASSPSR